MIYDFVRFVSGIPFFLICTTFILLVFPLSMMVKNMPSIIKVATIVLWVLFYSVFVGAKFFGFMQTVPTRWLQSMPPYERMMMAHEIWTDDKPLTIYQFVIVNRVYLEENAIIHSKPQINKKQVSPIVKKELHAINEN